MILIELLAINFETVAVIIVVVVLLSAGVAVNVIFVVHVVLIAGIIGSRQGSCGCVCVIIGAVVLTIAV